MRIHGGTSAGARRRPLAHLYARWIIAPGSEFFVVFNQDLLADGWAITRGRTEPAAKLVWTFRF